MQDPLKKALDFSERIIHGVKEGQSNNAPIDIPGTHQQRDSKDCNHITDLRTGEVHDRKKPPAGRQTEAR
jgi:hypothetical protein